MTTNLLSIHQVIQRKVTRLTTRQRTAIAYDLKHVNLSLYTKKQQRWWKAHGQSL